MGLGVSAGFVLALSPPDGDLSFGAFSALEESDPLAGGGGVDEEEGSFFADDLYESLR